MPTLAVQWYHSVVGCTWLIAFCFIQLFQKKKTRQSFNCKLELNISTLDWPVWDVFITLCFRQLSIRRKNNIFLIRYLEVVDFWRSSKKAETLIITYPFTQNLQSSLPGTVVVKYASSKRQEYNLVVNVVFYCYFLKKLFWRHIKPFASRLTVAGLRPVKKVAWCFEWSPRFTI